MTNHHNHQVVGLDLDPAAVRAWADLAEAAGSRFR
jgi:hypothetical protein